MKLSAESLKKLTKGACYYETERGYLTAFKYSKAQLDMMRREGYDSFWLSRALFSAGIRLELKTSALNISFDYRIWGDTEIGGRSNSVDIWVDGVLISALHLKEKKGNVSIKLPLGKKLVKIYLPNDLQLSIKNFTLDGAYESVKDKGQRVLVIGDSITQGYGPMISSVSYFNELQRMTGYNMLNQGIGGYRFEANDLMLIDGFEPDKIISFLGTNWYDVPDRYDYESATADYYNRLTELYPDKPILAISPIWRCDDALDMDRLNWCIEIIKRECKKHENITLIDGFTLVPNVADCYCDKVHPNEYGCLMLAKNLYKSMKKVGF